MGRNDSALVWGIAEMVQELQKLIAHGVIGIYNSFEITEIIGFKRDNNPKNFLTVVVAEPAEPPTSDVSENYFLNESRLTLNADWKVGIVRYRISLQALVYALNGFSQTGEWKPGRAPLQVGALVAIPPQFVPADSFKENPWNRILKNNFFEGSHVLELFDTSKLYVRFLLEDSRLLTKLARLIGSYAPVAVDGLSDRLGNVLIQLPVTVISTATRGSPEGHYTVTLGWHPEVPSRPVRITAEIYEDSTVEAYDSAIINAGSVTLRLNSRGGGARTHIWDEHNLVLLGATPVTAFITSMALSMHAVGSGTEAHTREFQLPDNEGHIRIQSILLQPAERPHMIGSAPERPREPWRQSRVFKKSLVVLQTHKEFVQYGHAASDDRGKALEDIRWLIEKYGAEGVWLWDPYLQADDVLHTLFFCPHDGVELRALTAGEEPRSYNSKAEKSAKQGTPSTALQSWERKQALRLETAKGDCCGLRLEFRIRKGRAGWPFHDRFIIFPKKDGPAVAWSLGTSVNGLGKQHHILQKVSNGELIANAFRDLWNELDAIEHLVWKTL
ncbi:MAG: hypothetical protein J0M09_02750 [Xanthomonadales bacterium]|nr:hypothetical protein [Xanthomonadales bacterium]